MKYLAPLFMCSCLLSACGLQEDGSQLARPLEANQCADDPGVGNCWADECDGLDPYAMGCAGGAGEQVIVDRGIMHDGAGNSVAEVHLWYSCRCNSYWSEILRTASMGGGGWVGYSYEIAASYADDAGNHINWCGEPPGDPEIVTVGLTTYACNYTGTLIYTDMHGSGTAKPTACGWIRLKEREYPFTVVDFMDCGVGGGNRPPICDHARATQPELSVPPNHDWSDAVGVVNILDPDGDSITVTIDDVSSDQPANGLGDGNTDIDWRLANLLGSQAQVRAERAGTDREGRTYTMAFTASDGRGGTCNGDVPVHVRHDQGDRE